MPNDSTVNHDTCMVTGTGPETFQVGAGNQKLQTWNYSWTEWVAHTQHEEHANARGSGSITSRKIHVVRLHLRAIE